MNADRRRPLDHYGKVTGPLNAKGMLVAVEGEPRGWNSTATTSTSRNIPASPSISRPNSPARTLAYQGREL